MALFTVLNHVTGNLLFVYGIVIITFYLGLTILSLIELTKYASKQKLVNYKELLSSPFAPSVSLIAPSYNEGLTIIENVRSLLSIQYNAYEVIVVNDGSTDDSMNKMIKAFDLVKVPFYVEKKLRTKKIKGVFKSTNKALKRLIVVDKDNGGKADALNVGLNVSIKDLVACIDVDCVIEPDALLKLVKPFMDDERREVIACGGVIRVANDCVIHGGRLVKARVPENFLARFQVVEYLRAFLLGRVAWTKLNGLLLISGALGMFDRKIAVAAGGYNPQTVGEDMELVVRMRSYMIRCGRRFKVAYIPDPLCWTEVPQTNQVLGSQRNRWTRGTVEVLLAHKHLFFNPKYKVMGLLSYPFWVFFEWMAPLVEVGGITYFMVLVFSGNVWWSHALVLLGLVYLLSVSISIGALLAEEISYARYTHTKDIWRLVLAILLEPFLYHPKVVFWALKGNIDYWKGKKQWGEMTRTGFQKSTL